jgi:hypothetical protein
MRRPGRALLKEYAAICTLKGRSHYQKCHFPTNYSLP